MASEQEAEQIIRSLNSDINAKRLLYEVLRFTNSRVFAKAIAAEMAPSVVFRVLASDRIVIELNDDGLTKADLEAICGPASEEQPKGFDFKEIVVACKKVHIQSGNFSFEFQHNIFDLTDSLMRPVWVSPAKTTPVNLTRITLYLHDQGDKNDVENLRNIVHSLFEGLHEATPLFLKDLELSRPSADFEDENNEPLLEDPMHDTFLSHDYPLAAALSLKDYGLAALTRSQFLDLLEIDLENPNSKMRTNTSKSWHSAVARLLSRILTDDECPKSDVKSDAQSDAANDDYPTVGASETLSNALDYVSKHHKDKFLGILEHLWVFEGPAILKCPALVSKIKGLPALTLCSVDSSRELQITWFPSNHLKSYVRNFMEHPDEFPFLKLDEEKDINLALASKWAFLTKNLGVKWKYDLSFLLEILKSIRRHSGTALSSSQIEKVLALYATIGEKFPLSTIEDKEQALNQSGRGLQVVFGLHLDIWSQRTPSGAFTGR
uniref:Uncharacterized protein n=1 Tax=Fusarium oxysporum (strain Fo5176) TaxID=660025 RepID=A0A0D2XJC6_FUSOF